MLLYCPSLTESLASILAQLQEILVVKCVLAPVLVETFSMASGDPERGQTVGPFYTFQFSNLLGECDFMEP